MCRADPGGMLRGRKRHASPDWDDSSFSFALFSPTLTALHCVVVCSPMKSLRIQGLLDKPLVFFGHCFGSYVALEICWRLEHDFDIIPRRLIVSSMVIAPNVSMYESISGNNCMVTTIDSFAQEPQQW